MPLIWCMRPSNLVPGLQNSSVISSRFGFLLVCLFVCFILSSGKKIKAISMQNAWATFRFLLRMDLVVGFWVFLTTPYSTPTVTHRDASDNKFLVLSEENEVERQVDLMGLALYRTHAQSHAYPGGGSSTFFRHVAFMRCIRTWESPVSAYFGFVQMVLCCLCH